MSSSSKTDKDLLEFWGYSGDYEGKIPESLRKLDRQLKDFKVPTEIISQIAADTRCTEARINVCGDVALISLETVLPHMDQLRVAYLAVWYYISKGQNLPWDNFLDQPIPKFALKRTLERQASRPRVVVGDRDDRPYC